MAGEPFGGGVSAERERKKDLKVPHRYTCILREATGNFEPYVNEDGKKKLSVNKKVGGKQVKRKLQ